MEVVSPFSNGIRLAVSVEVRVEVVLELILEMRLVSNHLRVPNIIVHQHLDDRRYRRWNVLGNYINLLVLWSSHHTVFH